MSAPLFITPDPVLEKQAGYRLPREASLWQSEIIQHLATQHPYLPLDRLEVNFKKIDPRKGAAIGSIVVGDKIAIPVIVSRPSPGKDPELKPLDVFFYEDKYRYLDPDTVKAVIMRPEIGFPAKRPLGGANYPGRNDHYIGDLTGDRSPLEHSYFGGSGSKVASADIGDMVNYPSSAEVADGIEKTAKERDSKAGPVTRSAASFGVAGGVGGAIREGIREAVKPGTGKQRATRALGKAARGAAFFAPTSAVAGGVSAKALEGLGMSRDKLTPEAKKQVKQIAKRVDASTEKKASARMWRKSHRSTAGRDNAKMREGVILADAVNPGSEHQRRDGGTSDEHCRLRRQARGLLTSLREEGHLDPNDLANFRQLVSHKPEILLAARNNLSCMQIILEDLPKKDRVPRHPIAGPRVMQLVNTDRGLKIKFGGRDMESVDDGTLRQILGDRYQDAMQKVKDGHVFVLTEEINPETWSVDRTPKSAVPVDRDGFWLLRAPRGEAVPAFVAKSVMKLDGTVVPMKMAIAKNGEYSLGREMFGTRISDKSRLPGTGNPTTGDRGVFVHYVQGSPTVTVPVRISGVTTVVDDKGDERRIYKVSDLMSGENAAIIPSKDVYGIAPITWPEPATKAAIGQDTKAFAIPVTSEFIKTNGTFEVAQNGETVTKTASAVSELSVSEKDGLFSMRGTFEKDAVIGLLKDVARKGVRQIKSIATSPGKHAKGVQTAYMKGRTAPETGSVLGGVKNVAKAYSPALAVGGAAAGTGLAGYGAYKGMSGSKQAAFEDVVSVEWINVDKFAALEALVAGGMTGDDAQEIVKVAQERSGDEPPVIIRDLHLPIVIVDEEKLAAAAELEEEFDPRYEKAVISLRPSEELIKCAAESRHPETVDAILSLEFITPQNARFFYESIDQLEEVASKLAALLVAVRIGIQNVPEAAVRDALEGLSKTTAALKVLKSSSEGSRDSEG